MNFDAANWLAYREANMRFADTVAGMVKAGDMVWVQDYHLMLLPMLLRSIISGESAQGEMVRRELGRVKQGVDNGVVQDMLGMKPGVVEGDDASETLHEVAEEPGSSTERAAAAPDAGTVQLEEDVLEMKTSANTAANAGANGPPASVRRRPVFARGMSQFQKQEEAAKARGKEGVRIGFFLHTPFPSSEIYRCVGGPRV